MKMDAWQIRPTNDGIIFVEPMLDRIDKLIGLNDKKILHLFSGKSKIGDTCDIIPFFEPKFNIDCTKKLPFDDESYDIVLADPPYTDSKQQILLYNLKPYSFVKEAVRVLKTGGYLVILHFLNYRTPEKTEKTHLIGIDIGPNFSARWLNIFRKQPTLLTKEKISQ